MKAPASPLGPSAHAVVSKYPCSVSTSRLGRPFAPRIWCLWKSAAIGTRLAADCLWRVTPLIARCASHFAKLIGISFHGHRKAINVVRLSRRLEKIDPAWEV
jgi:hypothetical protein